MSSPTRTLRGLAILVCSVLSACSDRITVGIVDDAPAAEPADAASGVSMTAAPDASRDSCEHSVSIDVCDPIRNTGCSRTLSMQCDVDLLAATLSGQCVFNVPASDAGLCINIPPTESCPPGQTCVDGDRCHSVCLCDADCPAGECCTTPLANLGFKTCAPC